MLKKEKNIRFRFTENILKTSLAISIALLLVISSENFRQFQSFTKSQQHIIKSHEILNELQKLLSHIYEIENMYNMYVFTENKEVLNEYDNTILTIDSQIEHLQALTHKDSINHIKIDLIQSKLNGYLLNLEKEFLNFINKGDGSEDSSQNVKSNTEISFEEIKVLIKELSSHEFLLLQKHKNIGSKKHKINPLLLLLTVVFSISIFIISFIFINSYLRKIKKSNERLRINNMIYEQAEKLAFTGHWYFKPGTNDIVFSNNLYRLLGFKPNSFKPNLKKYLGIISDGDRPKLIAELKKLKQTGTLEAIDIAIIDANGKEKCLRFIARVVEDELGNNLVIGANKDLTYEIETNRKLTELNDDLIFQNEIYKNAESIAMIGSYTYDVERRECEFSDNLYRILGHEPNSFEASRETLINFVHNDDKVEFIKSTALEKMQDRDSVYRFRLIDNKKRTKYILTNGKLFINEKRKILIVTLKDITEEVKISLSLKENIEELYKSNEELESFNHIASHDLQEPLRKIQIFISMLNSSSKSELSDQSAEYLHKINLAANRMRDLVNDLLNFSKTSKEDKIFERIKLADLLNNVLKELHPEIVEKNASITFDPLPDATVITFQFQQLFVNLISNSLKYSQNNVAPTIEIRNQELNRSDLINFPILRGKDLVKISFKDNGIGFDDQYAKKIFSLFFRLHNKQDYYGTGIGLAICKKILQNHNGIIYAESNPGKGAEFTIVFPKQPA